MRVDLDAKVITSDGEEIGTVDRVVFDPRTNDITGFVISTGGLLGKSVVISRAHLERATRDGERLRLNLSKREVGELPSYVPVNYLPPTDEWVPPIGYGYPGSAYLWPAAVAPEAFMPPEALSAEEERQRQRVTVSKGATVQDRDGDDVGVIEDVRLDSGTGELRGVVVRLGGVLETLFGGGKTVDLPAENVLSVDEGVIRLRLDRDEPGPAA